MVLGNQRCFFGNFIRACRHRRGILGCYRDLACWIERVHYSVDCIVGRPRAEARDDDMKAKKIYTLLAALLIAQLATSAVSVDRLRSRVRWLADPLRDGRGAGTPGAAASAKCIFDELKEMGFDVAMQEFSGNRRNVVARS